MGRTPGKRGFQKGNNPWKKGVWKREGSLEKGSLGMGNDSSKKGAQEREGSLEKGSLGGKSIPGELGKHPGPLPIPEGEPDPGIPEPPLTRPFVLVHEAILELVVLEQLVDILRGKNPGFSMETGEKQGMGVSGESCRGFPNPWEFPGPLQNPPSVPGLTLQGLSPKDIPGISPSSSSSSVPKPDPPAPHLALPGVIPNLWPLQQPRGGDSAPGMGKGRKNAPRGGLFGNSRWEFGGCRGEFGDSRWEFRNSK